MTPSKLSAERLPDFHIRPDPDDGRLSQAVFGIDQDGKRVDLRVVNERALTLFLNAQEIVTMMTIGDRPDLLAVGYLLNQNMLRPDDIITGIDHDEDLEVVIVRTERATNYEEKMKKRVRTSGCAQGTVFGDVMERFDEIALDFFTSDQFMEILKVEVDNYFTIPHERPQKMAHYEGIFRFWGHCEKQRLGLVEAGS